MWSRINEKYNRKTVGVTHTLTHIPWHVRILDGDELQNESAEFDDIG